MITDRIARHEVLLPIDHKKKIPRREEPSYERKGKFAIKDWKRRSKLLNVVIAWFKLQLWMWLVDLKYNFECDWLIELSDNKLSDNNLASELVENRSFFNQSQSRELYFFFLFYDYSDSLVKMSYTTKFWSNMMKKDISANFYQKCFILCSKILLHNTSLRVLLPW